MASKRAPLVSADESSESESTTGNVATMSKEDDAKTIPFLRRLVDMLSGNDDVISFFPGKHYGDADTPPKLGQIVVHDRLKVESMILPRYFNHSSFASLRRQLNYFSFTRVGKGRQRGATYCNEGVVELEDILRLKRRPTPTSSSKSGIAKRGRIVSSGDMDGEGEDAVVPVVPIAKKIRLESPVPAFDEVPDLTQQLAPFQTKHPLFQIACNDQEILAGCNALLSFSRGFAKSS